MFHRDFDHNKIVVNDDYIALSVIDWEHACPVSRECIYYPITSTLVPALVNLPALRDAGSESLINERVRYIENGTRGGKNQTATVLVVYHLGG